MEPLPHPAHGGLLSVFVPSLAMAGLLLAYLLAAARERRSRRGWNGWRTASFIVGVALLGVALSPPVAGFAHRDLRGHMIQHLLIGMLAPLGLVLAAPLTLAFRTLPVQASRFLAALVRSRPIHGLSHPFTALLLNIGGMYLLYLTPLYEMTLTRPALHALVHVHFLAAGCLFTWAIAGPDPAPRRPGMRTRLVVLFLGIASHATLSKLLYIHLWPADTPHGADEIRAAAKLMYYGGDFAELLLTIALFATWYWKGGEPLLSRSLPLLPNSEENSQEYKSV